MELIEAVKKKDIEKVKELLNKGVDDIDKKDKYNMNPLLHAAEQSSTEIMELLLKNGANVNIQGYSNGLTALFFAVHECNIEAIKLLLQFGADVNIKNAFKETILQWAISSNCKEKLEIMKLLLDRGADVFTNKTNCESVKSVECEKLLAEYRWKKLYERDKDTARRYALNTENKNEKEEGIPFIPKDIWEIILLNKRREQLCRNLNSDKNLEILKLFALEFGIPITDNMNKGKICGLLSRYIVYGKNPKPLERVEREEAELKNKVREIAYKMGLNPEDSLSSLLTQLGKIF